MAERSLTAQEKIATKGSVSPLDEVNIWSQRAYLDAAQGKPDDAMSLADTALKLQPNMPDAVTAQAVVQMKCNRTPEEVIAAVAILEKQIADHPRDVWAAKNLAEYYEGLGDSRKSLNYYRIAFGISPKDSRLSLKIASLENI